MEHVVFFTGADGAAQYRRTQSLEEAVRAVEYLRNVEGVEDTRVYALAEVPLAFKTVYRVEVQASDGGAPGPLPPMPPMPPMPDLELGAAPEGGQPAAEAAPAAPAEAPVEAVAEAPEPVMAAVPSEPYEPPQAEASNGKPATRGTGFFSR